MTAYHVCRWRIRKAVSCPPDRWLRLCLATVHHLRNHLRYATYVTLTKGSKSSLLRGFGRAGVAPDWLHQQLL